jgi:hypothetical protein
VQHPHLPIGTRHADRGKPAWQVGSITDLGGDFGEVPFCVFPEMGDPGAEHAVVKVAG